MTNEKVVRPKWKKAKLAERLASRFLSICYAQFDLLEKKAVNLAYTYYLSRFEWILKEGTIASELPEMFWKVLSVRTRKPKEQSPYWPIAQSLAERFIEENRILIAEEFLTQ